MAGKTRCKGETGVIDSAKEWISTSGRGVEGRTRLGCAARRGEAWWQALGFVVTLFPGGRLMMKGAQVETEPVCHAALSRLPLVERRT